MDELIKEIKKLNIDSSTLYSKVLMCIGKKDFEGLEEANKEYMENWSNMFSLINKLEIVNATLDY